MSARVVEKRKQINESRCFTELASAQPMRRKTYLDAVQDALAGVVRGGGNLGLGGNGGGADIDEKEVCKGAPDVDPVSMCVCGDERGW